MPVFESHDSEQQKGGVMTVFPQKCPFYLRSAGLCLVSSSGGFRPADNHVQLLCKSLRYRDGCDRYLNRGRYDVPPIEQRVFRRVSRRVAGAFTGGSSDCDPRFQTVDLGLGGLRLTSRMAKVVGECTDIVLFPEVVPPINARVCLRWVAPRTSEAEAVTGFSFEPPLHGLQFSAFQALLWTDGSV
jgi:hypothetical protein